jgi:chromate transport protein ChrA
VTVLMTAGFSAIRSQPLVQAVMKGVLPATIGLSLTMAINMAQPVLTRAYQEGRTRLAIHLLILAGAALLMAVPGVSPVVVLLLAGGLAILFLALNPVRVKQPQEKAPDESA